MLVTPSFAGGKGVTLEFCLYSSAIPRSVIAFAPSSELEMKGSARSIMGVHIRNVLEAIAKKYPTLLNKFGGHAIFLKGGGFKFSKTAFYRFSSCFR
jgi:single-stranded-DNA-specific exonuclease